jgi:hypothetical protein
MDDPILTTDDSRPLRVLGYAGLWADALRSMIAPPASTWVRGPLGRRPTVDDSRPREYLGTQASGPTPHGR